MAKGLCVLSCKWPQAEVISHNQSPKIKIERTDIRPQTNMEDQKGPQLLFSGKGGRLCGLACSLGCGYSWEIAPH